LKIKEKQAEERLAGYSGGALFVARLVSRGDSSKKILKLERDIENLQRGDLRSVNVFVMPGYVLQREIEAIGKGSIHKMIMSNCFELYGKKHAANKTKHLLAQLLSFPLIGVAFTLMTGVIFLRHKHL